MAAFDPQVDAYIDRAAEFAQPILRHLRTIVHDALPDADEGMKWGMPHFMIGGKNVAGVAAFKSHCALILHQEDRESEGMGNYGKIRTLDDLPDREEIRKALISGRERALAKEKVKRGPKKIRPEISMPDDFGSMLAANPAASATFEGLTAVQKRDYLEWVVSAKQATTRQRRMEQSVEWMSEGKRLNWRYGG